MADTDMFLAALFLIEGFEETEALTTVDILRRGQVSLATLSLAENIYVTGSHGITVRADALARDVWHKAFDMLILPGGPGSSKYLEHLELIDMVKDSYARGSHIAAICAAPVFLGELGLLYGKSAICYPALTDKLKTAGAILPTMEAGDEAYVVTDGNITTSLGPGTTIDFALRLLKIIKDTETANHVADAFLYRR